MNRLLRIADSDGWAFLSMPDVLAPLGPEAHALRWYILDLGEVSAEQRWDLNLPVIERGILESASGFELSFEELSAFAARVTQVIWGLFVGYARSAGEPRRSDDDETLLKNAEMVVAAIDSSFWLVSAPDPVAARFEQRFQHVSEVGSAIGLRE